MPPSVLKTTRQYLMREQSTITITKKNMGARSSQTRLLADGNVCLWSQPFGQSSQVSFVQRHLKYESKRSPTKPCTRFLGAANHKVNNDLSSTGGSVIDGSTNAGIRTGRGSTNSSQNEKVRRAKDPNAFRSDCNINVKSSTNFKRLSSHFFERSFNFS